MKGDKIHYRSGYKYQLVGSYRLQIQIKPNQPIDTEYLSLTTDGMLTIKDGYAWDGPSGPTIDTKSSMRGALVHDAGYQLMRLKLISRMWRPYFDGLLRDICIEDGMWRWRANMWYDMVRQFAESAADPHNDAYPVIEAP